MPEKLLFITNLEDNLPTSIDNGKYTVNSYNNHPKNKTFTSHKDTSGNTIYVIDIHYKLKDQSQLQSQNGIDFYRYLLNFFSKCQKNLKVIFYSPLPLDFLLKEKPENHILSVLPFIQIKGDGDFEKELLATINKNTNEWPILNSASENLLSGWALYKQQNPTTHKINSELSILILDDQIDEWKICYNTIFEDNINIKELKYDKKKEQNGHFSTLKFGDSFKNDVQKSELILADFYLEEQHKPFHWMSHDELKLKSGYKLFDKIKGQDGINPSAAYIIHSSSNKIQYFKNIYNDGLDNWLVKDTRGGVSTNQKKYNYEIFKKEIELYTTGENATLFKRLTVIREKIQNFESIQTPFFWWDNNTDKQLVINTLNYCWKNLRNVITKESHTLQNNNTSGFLYNSIVNELGKILEIKKVNSLVSSPNLIFNFLKQFRNEGSHYNATRVINIKECILYFEIWLKILSKQKISVFKNSDGQNGYLYQDFGNGQPSFTNRKLLCLLQLLNSNCYGKLEIQNTDLEKRIQQQCKDLLEFALKDINTLKKELFETSHQIQLATILGTSITKDASSYYLDTNEQTGYFELFET